jgi:MoaA/NifB/PqqE/SkfB family radical SAM enzyme
MIQDNPICGQNKELVYFGKKYKNIFLFGTGETQYLIAKYLRFCDISPRYVVEESEPVYRGDMEVFTVEKAAKNFKLAGSGIIISASDADYTRIFSHLINAGFKNIFFISEWNKRTIPHKMRPRTNDLFWLEVNLADHCNLNCQMCDHFSPVAEKIFLDYDQYVKDIKRLADLTGNHIDMMKLQGGEPLLNNRCIDFIRVTREIFPRTRLWFFTDGLLLLNWEKHPSGNLWQVFKENNVEIQLTIYPINLNYEAVKLKAEEYGVSVSCFAEVGDRAYTGVKHSVKHPFDLKAKQAPWQFISCYQFNESIVLRDGKIYTCPMIPYAHHLNKRFGTNLKVTDDDFIDIYKAKSYDEIAEFCTHRVPFCNYCAVALRSVHEWKQSAHNINEWILTPGSRLFTSVFRHAHKE